MAEQANGSRRLNGVEGTRSYERDFFAWTQETARAIEAGRFDEIDRVALADEVESLGKRDRREIVSRLATIVTHLLKTKYQPEKQTRSWQNTIDRERRELDLLLADSPSLKAQLPELLDNAYGNARGDFANETGIGIDVFPETCEWSVAEVLGA
jgi:hypothetical protein